MKSKSIRRLVSFILPGGEATIAFPTGPMLAQFGVKATEFINNFNEVTKDWKNLNFFVDVIVYKNSDYDFLIKMPPISFLLDQIKIELENEQYIITKTDLYNIAKLKCGLDFTLFKSMYIMTLNSAKLLKIKIINA